MSHDDYHRFLEKGRKLYEAGDKGALLYYLDFCIRCHVPIPDWLRQAFLDARDAVETFKVKSWDDVFGKPLKKGKRLTTERRKRAIAVSIYVRVDELHKAGKPIDTELFRAVGKEFGVGSTVAKQLYYKFKKDLEAPIGDDAVIIPKFMISTKV